MYGCKCVRGWMEHGEALKPKQSSSYMVAIRAAA